jgi:hypothetical protein
MDFDRVAVTAEIYHIRTKSWLRFSVAVAGLILVFLGVYNMFAPLLFDVNAFRFYRFATPVVFDRGAFYFEDIAAMAVGAVMAWWS